MWNYKNKILFLFGVANIIFIAYLFLLGSYNGLSNDDWVFIEKMKETGFWNFLSDTYMTWQGRFSSFFITACILKLYNLFGNIFFLPYFLFALGVSANYLLLSLFIPIVSKKSRFFISCFIFNIFVLGSLDFTTFYWACACTYFTLVFLTEILIYLLLSNKTNFWVFLCIIFLSILIGGGAEHYTSIVIMCIGLYYLYIIFRVKNNLKSALTNKNNLKFLVSLIVLFISFVIMIVAPGNAKRMNEFSQSISIQELFINSIKPYAQLWVYLFSKLFVSALCFIPFYYVGRIYNKNNRLINNVFSLRNILISIGLLFIFLWLSILPGVYATSFLTPLRALTYLSFVCLLFFSFWGFHVGYNKSKDGHKSVLILSIFLIVLSISKIFVDIPRCQEYQNNVRERTNRLLFLKSIGTKGIVDLDSIKYRSYSTPSTCIFNLMERLKYPNRQKYLDIRYFPLLVDEITDDENDFRNQILKKRLGLDFDIRLKK